MEYGVKAYTAKLEASLRGCLNSIDADVVENHVCRFVGRIT